MGEFEGWRHCLEPAVLLWKPDDHDYEKASFMTWKDGDEPEFTPEQEHARIAEQVKASDGFDIDFSGFHCVFNYHPANLKSHRFVDKPETTEDLFKRLSREALDGYNKEDETKFEFVKAVKANFHWSTGIMFLITFEVNDPYDNLTKFFQARVRYAKRIFTEHVFCRPKPNQEVECIGTIKKDVEKDAMKRDNDFLQNRNGWRHWLEPAVLLWKPDNHDYEKASFMTWKDGDEPEFTPEQEHARIAEQVKTSDGSTAFSINLKSHRFVDKPETTEDLLKRLSQEALDGYNKEHETKFEFVKAVKANFHWSTGIMFLITFDVKDPYDNLTKVFQAYLYRACILQAET